MTTSAHSALRYQEYNHNLKVYISSIVSNAAEYQYVAEISNHAYHIHTIQHVLLFENNYRTCF